MWILDAAHDPFPDIIEYKGKPVWDAMSDQSLAHETANIPHMCRCKVGAINIDTSDIEESIRLLRQAFEQKGETEPLEPDVAE